MSSFIHSSTHFNSVQKAIENYLEARKDFSYSLNPVFDQPFTVAMVKPFMDTLRKLSVLCVSYQYEDHYENIDAEIKTQTEILFSDLKTTKIINNPIDLIRAIGSIDYQIEISHLEEVRDLEVGEVNTMKLLKVLPHAIALEEIKNTKQYDESKTWSL
jgi:2-keto-4-pentenoate hydratase/2-oxohepta-3-ene-1,7-dioic acid hydratase in catechol pathway